MKHYLHLVSNCCRSREGLSLVTSLFRVPQLRWALTLFLTGVASLSRGQCFQNVPGSVTSSTQVASYDSQSASVGDFNADGKPDLVTVDPAANSISLLIGNGNGGFGTITGFSVGKQPYAVATGDFNADNKTDIVTANYGSNTVSVLINNGSGGFSPVTSFSVGNSPVSVITNDFNGDGKLDLATANQQDNTISLLLGDGSGFFGKPVSFSTGESYNRTPKCIRAGDFDGDRKPDLVVLNDRYDSRISLLINNGNGGFGPATVSDALLAAHSVEVGDFNADGKLDLVAAGWGDMRITILLNKGNGGFTSNMVYGLDSNPYYVAVGDFNGDGKPDLAFNNNTSVAVLAGKGDGSFGNPIKFSVNTEAYVKAIVTGDFNIDGKPDLAVSTAEQVGVLLSCTVPPKPTTNSSQTATVGIPFSYTANAFTQADSSTSLTYSASISPANGLNFEPTTRIISGTPSTTGVSNVTIAATDPVGLGATTSFTITVLAPIILATDEPANSGLTVSPNPTADAVHVSLANDYRGAVSLTLVNNTGQTVRTGSLVKISRAWQHTLPVQGLPPGVYYLIVQQGDQQTVRKVVTL